MSKLLASLISALIITTIITLYSEYEKDTSNVLYYSFLGKLGMGFLVVFSFYLLIGIPVSMIIDRYIRSRKKWVKVLIYSLGGASVGIAFLTINPTNSMSGGLTLILQFGIAGFIFGIVHTVISRKY